MNEYLSKEFIEKILNAHMLDSNGAEHYAYSTLKRELMVAPGTSIKTGKWVWKEFGDHNGLLTLVVLSAQIPVAQERMQVTVQAVEQKWSNKSMRVENAKVKITIPIPIDKPDVNGIVYTEEAVSNAINNLQSKLPILFKENAESDEKVIGATGTQCIVSWDSDNQVCKLTVDGVLFYSGAEIIVNEMTNDGKITDFRIASIGLTV